MRSYNASVCRWTIYAYFSAFGDRAPLVFEGAARYAASVPNERFRFVPIIAETVLASAPASVNEHPDGVLTQNLSPAQIIALPNTSSPCVCLGTEGPLAAQNIAVRHDYAAMGRLAAEHLVARGHRDLVVLHHAQELAAHHMAVGFAQAVRRLDARLHDWPVQFERSYLWRWEKAYPDLDVRLAALPKPCGLLVWNSHVGAQVLDALTHTNKRAPEDVALVAIDSFELAHRLAPMPLSTIQPDYYELGWRGMAILHRLLRGEQLEAISPPLVVPREVITRRSSDSFCVDDPAVSLSMKHIHINAHRADLQLDTVAHAVGISRGGLDRKFRARLGRTMHEELVRVRVDRARALLSTTDLSVAGIAYACGYEDPQRLYENFRKLMGCTPAVWREQMQQGT
jgi:LacI family transcriptional regulator